VVGPFKNHESLKDLPLDGELRFDQFDMGKLRAALPVIKQGLPMALDLRGVYSSQGIRLKGLLTGPRYRVRLTEWTRHSVLINDQKLCQFRKDLAA
jgi:hypothetical protein